MVVVFFIPMVCIGLLEAMFDPNRNVWLRDWVHSTITSDNTTDARDPKVTGKDAEKGLVISKIPFTELIKEFPKTTMVRVHHLGIGAAAKIGHFQSAETTVLSEFGKMSDSLNKRVNSVEEKMDLIIKLLQEKDKEEWR